MTTSRKFVERAIDLINQAVSKDDDGAHREALTLYKQGIEYLLVARRHEKIARIKSIITAKIKVYLKRAEEVSDTISKTPAKSKSKATMKSGGGGGAADDGEDDEEELKLRETVSHSILVEKPNVKWSDVAGLSTAKALLKEAVILPIQFPQLFTGKRKPWAGILLYGPPGTGKSFLAKAVATEATGSTFLSVSSSDLVSKYVGESERLVKQLFVLARRKKPAIIFIDEIDSLCSKRGSDERDSTRRVKTEFLVQMQGVGKDQTGVLVLGATNCPWDLDPAVRRRFTKRIYIPLPDSEACAALFRIHIGKEPNTLTPAQIELLASRCQGFSGSDIAGIVQDALMQPVRVLQDASHFKRVPKTDSVLVVEGRSDDDDDYWLAPCSPGDPLGFELQLMDVRPEDYQRIAAPILSVEHFLRVLLDAKPSVGKEDLRKNEQWTQEFGQEGA